MSPHRHDIKYGGMFLPLPTNCYFVIESLRIMIHHKCQHIKLVMKEL